MLERFITKLIPFNEDDSSRELQRGTSSLMGLHLQPELLLSLELSAAKAKDSKSVATRSS